MTTLTLELPDFITLTASEIKFFLAAKLYENGKLSLGQAVDLAGVSKRTLTELLGQYGVSTYHLLSATDKRGYDGFKT